MPHPDRISYHKAHTRHATSYPFSSSRLWSRRTLDLYRPKGEWILAGLCHAFCTSYNCSSI